MQIFCYAFVSVGELHKLGVLDCHEARRNVMSLKCFLELIPNYFHILRQGISDGDTTKHLQVLATVAKNILFSYHLPP
jgi:hypothetical protein